MTEEHELILMTSHFAAEQLQNHEAAHGSSIYLTHNATYAFDGNTTTVSISEEEDAPWVAIEYVDPTEVGKVELVADQEHAVELKNCEVRLLDNITGVLGSAMYTEGTLLGSWAGPASDGETITINPPGKAHFATGKYLLVQCATEGARLRLAEVRVFGGENFLLLNLELKDCKYFSHSRR